MLSRNFLLKNLQLPKAAFSLLWFLSHPINLASFLASRVSGPKYGGVPISKCFFQLLSVYVCGVCMHVHTRVHACHTALVDVRDQLQTVLHSLCSPFLGFWNWSHIVRLAQQALFPTKRSCWSSTNVFIEISHEEQEQVCMGRTTIWII